MKRIKDLNIFVIDDNPVAQKSYQQYFARLGCVRMRMYDNGADCLQDIGENPDLVLIDYYMLPLNGLEVLIRIRAFNPKIYTVMISGQTDLQVAVSAMKCGAFDYIIKGESESTQIATVLQRMLQTMNQVKRGRPRAVPAPAAYSLQAG